MSDLFFQRCLELAKQASEKNEVPIGAVLVKENQIIAEAYNQTEKMGSFIYHAEILVIQEACKKLQSKYLIDCQIYVSVEPCKMCRAASQLSRIESIHYLLPSEKFGEQGLGYFDTKVHYSENVQLAEESRSLLRNFFERKRENKNQPT